MWGPRRRSSRWCSTLQSTVWCSGGGCHEGREVGDFGRPVSEDVGSPMEPNTVQMAIHSEDRNSISKSSERKLMETTIRRSRIALVAVLVLIASACTAANDGPVAVQPVGPTFAGTTVPVSTTDLGPVEPVAPGRSLRRMAPSLRIAVESRYLLSKLPFPICG